MRQFTIGRLMLVIAGIAIAFGGSFELARINDRHRCTATSTTYCASKMRNIVLSLLQHVNEHGAFPTGTWPGPNLPPEHRLSWYVPVLPYMENQELWDSIDTSKPWYSVGNDQIACTRIRDFDCPDLDSVTSGGLMATPYIGIAGLGTDAPVLPKGHPRAGIFGYDRRTRLADIKDGAGCTMVLAESGRVAGSWLAGGPATVRGLDPAEQPYVGRGRQFGGTHSVDVMNVAFADGSVCYFRESIDPRVLEAVSTIAGGERLPTDQFP